MQILIIGATGNIGTETVKQLYKEGITPRAGVRDITAARKQLGNKAQWVPFDFEDFDTFRPALMEIDRVFFIAPHSNPVPTVNQFLKTAEEEGVKHIVFSSGRTTGDIPGKPLNQVELLVQAHSIPETIIRPGWFMQNFATWLNSTIPTERKLYLPAADSKTAFIDVRDIGAVVAAVSTGNDHEGQLYNLTSSEAIDHYQVTEYISKVCGQTVNYVALESEAFVKTMMEKGWTEATARYTLALYDIVRTGKEEEISPDVERILGRKPISFAQFAEDYKAAWK